ncbi:glycosyltransferase family 4 protein [Halosquirtibacter xylanolyticus]|uniref:glycosyltransferase family 4 protein n=1 Tax=Halosquirtibacter xylanolyticus TaxID=3374599 RepID=UPI003748D7B2|nr:glycosyltransferase family 4 protein [Prolixibacteraceae bacterium]
MKILHFSDSKVWGGSEEQLFYLLKNDCSCEHILVCLDETPSSIRKKDLSCRVICLKKRKKYHFQILRDYIDVLKNEEPDIIHIHTRVGLTLHYVLSKFFHLKAPIVFSKKNLGVNSAYIKRKKYNSDIIKRYICISNAVKDDLVSILTEDNRKNVTVIYDGIPTDKIGNSNLPSLKKHYSLPSDAFIVGNIANHTRAKDLLTLVEVVNILVNINGYKNIFVIQVGEDNKLTEQMKNKIEEYDISSNLILHGFQKNAIQLVPQFDLYTLTSEREGLSVSILEALAQGKAVVATNAGGIPEAVKDNYVGLLSPVKDAQSLANNITRLYEDRDLLRTFESNAIPYVEENFSLSKYVKDTCRVYHELYGEFY